MLCLERGTEVCVGAEDGCLWGPKTLVTPVFCCHCSLWLGDSEHWEALPGTRELRLLQMFPPHAGRGRKLEPLPGHATSLGLLRFLERGSLSAFPLGRPGASTYRV